MKSHFSTHNVGYQYIDNILMSMLNMVLCHRLQVKLLLCEKTYSNYAMKPAKMRNHLERIHSNKDEHLGYFKSRRQK